MNEPKVAVIAFAAALLVPAPRGLAAQLVSTLEAGQYTVSGGALPTSTLRLAPTFQFELPHATLRARGSAYISEQNLQIADGLVTGTFTAPTVYGVHAEMIGNASRAIDDRSMGNDQVDVQTRIHLLFNQHAGLWFGGGVARPWRVAVASSADVTDAGLWAKIGDALAKFGTATMTATFTNFSFTKMASVNDTGSAQLSCAAASPIAALANISPRPAFTETTAGGGVCERQSRFSDLEGSMHWEVGALELTAQTGYRFGDSYDVTADSKRWTAATATVWLNERIAVVGGGGRQPALPLRGLPARSFAMGGIELAYWPISKGGVPVSLPRATLVKTFEMHPLAAGTGMHKIIIHVGGVETVDVMGDFSDWSPLTLTRRGRDLWELSIPLSAGMHRINVRVDRGPWMAPPGIPTMHDSLNGDVGMIVVADDKSGK
jgi:hypothetical protein